MHAICSRRHLGVFARGAHIDQPPTTIGGNATSFSNSGQFSGSVISAPQLPLSAQGDGRLALTGVGVEKLGVRGPISSCWGGALRVFASFSFLGGENLRDCWRA